MLSEYGFDLVAEWETVTLRRLWVLVQGLPREAVLWREENAWTSQDELLAALVELTDIASRRVVLALGGKFPPGDKPIHIERPSREVERRVTDDPAAIAAWFAAHPGTN